MIITVKNYTFNNVAADHQDITFTDYASIDIERIIKISNIDRNITLFQVDPTNSISSNSSVTGNVFTVLLNFGTQNNSDKLHIAYDDPSYDTPLNLTDGRKVVTTAGTRVQLSSTSVPCKAVNITALSGNTGTIVVGGSTVVASLSTRSGTPLDKNDSCTVEISNLNKVYVDATVSGEGVSFSVEN